MFTLLVYYCLFMIPKVTWNALYYHMKIDAKIDDFVAIMRKIDQDGDGLLCLEDVAALAMQLRSQVAFVARLNPTLLATQFITSSSPNTPLSGQ